MGNRKTGQLGRSFWGLHGRRCCCAVVGVAWHGKFAAVGARWRRWPSGTLARTEEEEQRKGMRRGGKGRVSCEGGERERGLPGIPATVVANGGAAR